MFYGAQAACFSFTYGVFRSIFTRLFSLKRFENVSTWKTEIYILFFIMKNIAEWIFINTLFAFFSSRAKYSALALAGCVFLRLFYTLPSIEEMFQVEAFKVSYYFFHTNRKANCFLKFELLRSDLRLARFLNFFMWLTLHTRFLLSTSIIFYHRQKIYVCATLFMKLKYNKDKLFFRNKTTTTLVSPRHMSSRAAH